MPEPARTGQRYLPGLDGLRALAVLAVIAYHEQLGWAPGGLLGVGVFFTLSGYLITDLLLGMWAGDGRLHLGEFWIRRARRLLPALFVLLAVVTAWVTLADRVRLPGLRGPVAAAATYSSNWYLIAGSGSYFARFAPPGPLDHLWSLAVEEQFYLLWPWLLLLGLCCIRRRGAGALRWLTAATLVLSAASAVALLLLYQPGLDPTRVYEGTDTRAFGLLIGAALAMAWPSRRKARTPRRLRLTLEAAGIAGLAVIGLMIWRTGQYSPFAYRGGLVLLSVATAAVVAAAACPATVLGAALGWRPLRWIGVRSYGIYLWHYPVIVLTTPANAGEDLTRAALQVAASVALAALSWRFIEEPVRHGALGRLAERVRAGGWRSRPAPGAIAAVTGASALVAVCAAALGGAFPVPASGSGSAVDLAAGPGLPAASKSVTKARPLPAVAGPHAAADGPLRTSCQSVAHLGDSTSEGLVSPDYLPNPRKRLARRYEDVGVQTVRTDISGARSVVEVLPGQVNGYDAAGAIVKAGFRGCWVLALGTNDTADVAVGSTVSLMTRIQRMMSAARGEPVMWVNVISLRDSGPYAEANMRKWDAALLQACARYPNLRVFDWAAVVKTGWFISDGIHYTSAGYAARARLIAGAVAKAFPLAGHSPGCVVS
jgi:peptidoglycan/LPS O-acetylase OafA/YrhL/lysophospholipase L1-like esterase